MLYKSTWSIFMLCKSFWSISTLCNTNSWTLFNISTFQTLQFNVNLPGILALRHLKDDVINSTKSEQKYMKQQHRCYYLIPVIAADATSHSNSRNATRSKTPFNLLVSEFFILFSSFSLMANDDWSQFIAHTNERTQVHSVRSSLVGHPYTY